MSKRRAKPSQQDPSHISSCTSNEGGGPHNKTQDAMAKILQAHYDVAGGDMVEAEVEADSEAAAAANATHAKHQTIKRQTVKRQTAARLLQAAVAAAAQIADVADLVIEFEL